MREIYWKNTDDVYGMFILKAGWIYEVYFDGKYTRIIQNYFHLESDLKPEFLDELSENCEI